MSPSLLDSLATTDALAAVFSDAGMLEAMLEFEAALARAEASVGVIPAAAAAAISEAAGRGGLDAPAIAARAREGATPAIPFVNALRTRVQAADATNATYVHWGATSQDVTDTALVLLLRRARPIVAADHQRLARGLAALSERYASTMMLGRTLLQPATPITFGLKAAGWAASIARSWGRVDRAWDDALVVQFGGAAGTLAALGEHGVRVADALAGELGLRGAPPGHTDRDRLGALMTGCGLYVAALGKAARDVALLMQTEIGEASERGGGSSAMPQKQNPSGCALVLAAAVRMPGLVASYLAAMSQEHERGVGGIQAEWPVVSAIVQATGAAVAAMAAVVDGMTIDPARMRLNLDATRGTVFAERAILLLAPALGRDRAHRLVTEAVARSRQTDESFASALRSLTEGEGGLPPGLLDDIDRPERYLGAAEAIRTRLLGERNE